MQEIGDREGWKLVGERDGRKKKRYKKRVEGYENRFGVMTFTEEPVRCTFQELTEDYARMEKEWLESTCWADLQRVLMSLCSGHSNGSGGTKVDRCVLFGLGSPSGRDERKPVPCDEDRRWESLMQLATFVSVAKLIASCQEEHPPLFAQEPRFNDLDREFLQGLGIETVEHPEGFNLLTRNSFAYCPGAEQFVALRCFSLDPTLYLGREAKTWYDDSDRTSSLSRPPTTARNWTLTRTGINDAHSSSMPLMRGRQTHALPELERSIPTYLIWRQSTGS